MGNIFLKTIIIYFFLLVAVRLMGKKEIGQMQPVELVAIIIIADVASVPMQNVGTPIIQGIVPIFALLTVELVLSYLNIKFDFFHKIISGKPSVLISKGKVVQENLKKQRYTIDGLIEQLRMSGYPDIRDVDYAILETSGQMSVIAKEKPQEAQTEYVGFPRIVIMENKIYPENLNALGLNEQWLKNQLKENKLKQKDLFIFIVDESGKIFYQKKDE